jgi:hypothetical protein
LPAHGVYKRYTTSPLLANLTIKQKMEKIILSDWWMCPVEPRRLNFFFTEERLWFLPFRSVGSELSMLTDSCGAASNNYLARTRLWRKQIGPLISGQAIIGQSS